MNIDKEIVKYFIKKAEDARLNKDELKSLYGSNVEVFDIKETDTQGYILKENNNLIISFRGTQQIRDWFTDLNGFQIEYPVYNIPNSTSKIKVHRGFYIAYKSVRTFIHDYIKNNYPESITVCGHSLGGALATLCAVDIQYNFPNIRLQVYTSGQPKVGNEEFERSFNKRVPNMVRTYMRKDVVPMCPPNWLEKLAGGKFYHVGTSNPIGPKQFLFGFFSWFSRKNDDEFIEDLTNHSIDLYLKYCV